MRILLPARVKSNLAPLAQSLRLLPVGKQVLEPQEDTSLPTPSQSIDLRGSGRRRLRLGASGEGRSLFSEAWTDESHVFSAEGSQQPMSCDEWRK